jgi:methylthioribose-1-phosphate isomerase
MTEAFSDSVKKQITLKMPQSNYDMWLAYQSAISEEGKLLKPLISREVANGTVEDNDFVQAMRIILKAAPAWKPAFDPNLNKAVDGMVTFKVIIKNGKITITDTTGSKRL